MRERSDDFNRAGLRRLTFGRLPSKGLRKRQGTMEGILFLDDLVRGNITRIRVPVFFSGFRSDKFLKLLNI